MKDFALFAVVALVVAWFGGEMLPRGVFGWVVFFAVVYALHWLVKYLIALSAQRKE